MGMKKTTIYVVDMTCSACEVRIKRILEAQQGVKTARASLRGGTVDIEYDEEKMTVEVMKQVIERAGYTPGNGTGAGTTVALVVGLILAALYMVASTSGFFSAIPAINASVGYGMLFVVGILTSVHCVAMCGGIALSQSVGKLERNMVLSDSTCSRPAEVKLKKLIPGLLYNGGRVISYTIVGGLVGALGAAFSVSPVMKGVIAAVAGFFMLFLGLKMLGLLSGWPKIFRILPAPLRIAIDRLASALGKRGPFAVGLLNGFMPCGPLQTMQIYALGTGSFVDGALAMFIFSVGTVPLMLSFSLAAAFIPKKLVPGMVKTSAVLVIFLGLISFGRAATLAGISLPDISAFTPGITQPSDSNPLAIPAQGPENGKRGSLIQATLQDGVQSVLTDFGSSGYYLPFAVQAGIPVKWTIRVTEDGLNGCNNPITIPAYGIRKTLVPGDNLVEFIPEKEGTITYTCWMGMISSRITVVNAL